MADEVINAPVGAEQISAPTVEAPIEPVVAPVVEQAVVDQPVIGNPAEAPEVKSEPATFLSDAEPITQNGAETQPIVEQQSQEQSDEPAPLPTYDPFVLPEGLSAEQETMQNYTSLLGQFESTTKADHAEVQKLGQQLVDYHIAEVQKVIANIEAAHVQNQEQQEIAKKEAWKQDFISDPDIGGNRLETTVNGAKEVIRTHGGTPEQQAEFRKLMDETGIGNNKVMIRFLANLSHSMREGRMLPAQSPVPAKPTKLQAMYGKR